MATVYLAKDIRHDRDVAIKVLHPELSASIGAERFEREIKLSARLQHPHILGLIDSGQADGLLYYVMPFVKGEALRDRLDREGQLPIEDAIQITLEVADALGHAHEHGIVHRDIKPENILISGGHALVADFGIARAATEAGGQKLTQTGMAVGTPVYMSPEQSVGDATGPTADLYSLGCVLYEMLSGEPPFTAKNAQALMARHAMEAVPSIRIVRATVPEEVEDAIFSAMAKVPADRPQNAAQFTEMLGVQLGATASRRANIRSTASRRVPTGAHRARAEAAPWWRKPWVLGAAALVVVGGSFGLYRALASPRRTAGGAAELEMARTIGVLYFDADSSLREVADAFTESLIRSLKTVSVLTVRPATSVREFRGKEVPRDSIGRILNVGSIIEGSVLADGAKKLRVTARLLDGSGADLGRNTTIAVPRDSLFRASDSVAAQVAELLRQQLGPQIQLRESQTATRSQTAWTLLQRGEKARKDADLAGKDIAGAAGYLARADTLFGDAAKEDPSWIEPVTLRGQVALQRSSARFDTTLKVRTGWIQRADSFASQALTVDAKDAKALALRGTLRYAQWRLAQAGDPKARADLLASARADLDQAVAIDPGLATAYATLSNISYEDKKTSEALGYARKAYDADAYLSNADLIIARLFYTLYDTENPAEARTWCDRGGARFPKNPEFTKCQLLLLLVPDIPVDPAAAWRLVAKLDSLTPEKDRPFQSHFARMIVGGALGKKRQPHPLADSARRVLVSARGDATVDPKHELPGYEAVARAQIGDLDGAVDLLTEYVAQNPSHEFRVGNNVHWWWRDIQNKPGFQRILAARP